MTQRTFSLRTLHGNIDYTDAQARVDTASSIERQSWLQQNPGQDYVVPGRAALCDVIAVFVDPLHPADRIELHFSDWNLVGGLVEGLEITFDLPDAPQVVAITPADTVEGG